MYKYITNFFRENKLYPLEVLDKSKTKIHVLYLDRTYKINTAKNFAYNNETRSQVLLKYFNHYQNNFKECISNDLKVRKEAVFINTIKALSDAKIHVSYEIIFCSKQSKTQILKLACDAKYSATMAIRKFMKENLGCKNVIILGETKNVSCYEINDNRLSFFTNQY